MLANVILGLALAASVCGQTVDPVAAASASADAPPIEAILRQTPQNPPDAQARLDLARERVAGLRELLATPAAEESASAAALRAARTELVQAWEAYIEQLSNAFAPADRIATLKSEPKLQAVAEEISRLESETHEITNAPAPLWATDSDIQSVQASLQTLESEVTSLAQQQATRSALLAEGFQTQRQQVEQTPHRPAIAPR